MSEWSFVRYVMGCMGQLGHTGQEPLVSTVWYGNFILVTVGWFLEMVLMKLSDSDGGGLCY